MQNGVETFKILEDEPKTKRIPVLFLSALAQDVNTFKYDQEVKQNYKILGKPFDMRQILAAIEQLLINPENDAR